MARLLPRRVRWPPAANARRRDATAYDELRPDPWLADAFRAEMVRAGRTPVAEDVEAALPLGSTDMGNVTQVMPGIHPIVGIDAERRVHPPAGVRAAPRRRAPTGGRRGRDHAGAHGGSAWPRRRRSGTGCWNCRRRRTHEPRRRRRTRGWTPTTTISSPGAGTSTPTPSWGDRSSRPPSSSPRSWPTRASTRRCCRAVPG